jgi:hypothetical protein
LRPERANHVWSYDFVKAMTHDGRALRILVVIDEYTRECLALRVARRLGSLQVIETLADVMLVRGICRCNEIAKPFIYPTCKGLGRCSSMTGSPPG